MKRPSILKESAEIKQENLVGDRYIIAEEDIVGEPTWIIDDDEALDYIKSELGMNDDVNLLITITDEEHIEDTIEYERSGQGSRDRDSMGL